MNVTAPIRNRFAAGTIAASALLLMTACSAAESASEAEPEPTASQAPAEPTIAPVSFTCDDVITTAEQSTLGLEPASDQEPTALEAQAVELGGITCAYTFTTTGSPISFAVSTPLATAFTLAEGAAATDSNVVPTYGIPPAITGFFAVEDGVGIAQGFTESGVWLTATSIDFIEPGDAEIVMTEVLTSVASL